MVTMHTMTEWEMRLNKIAAQHVYFQTSKGLVGVELQYGTDMCCLIAERQILSLQEPWDGTKNETL